MATDLDGFLEGDETGQAEAEQPSAAAEHPETPLAATPGDPAQTAPPAEPAEDEHPVPDDVAGLRSAIQAERAKRNDHKGRADRLEGEAAALRAELEAARKAAEPKPALQQQPVTQRQAIPIPNPVEDPAGYHAWQEQQRFSDKLDISEDRLRETVGDDAAVDAAIARFKELAASNPALHQELRNHRHPYKFAYDYVKRSEALAEIGDPKSYREKLEAEIRARVEAEYAGTVQAQPAAAARIQLPQSLGTARSAGPRSMPVVNAAEEWGDILAVPRR
jgi:uncharacterized protein YhaN